MLQVDIEKFYNGEYWTNRYLVAGEDVSALRVSAFEIVEAERSITAQNVTFTRYRISDGIPGTDQFVTVPLNLFGALDVGGNLLPLFNVLRVDFSPAVGRTSRKYLRGVLSESFISGDTIAPATLAVLQSSYVGAMLNVAAFRGPQAEAFLSGACYSSVAMRQLRRGSKRRASPVLP